MIEHDNHVKKNEYLNKNIENIKEIKMNYNDFIITFKDGSTFGIYFDECDSYLINEK